MSFETHLSSGNTTLCYCWVIRRRDGQIYGFTDHDADVTIKGVVCSSTTGITTTKFAQSLGLTDDNLEIEGVIDDDMLSADDMSAGLFDSAAVELYVVNWSDPSEYMHVSSGSFGSFTSLEGGSFVTEFRSQSHLLSQPEGRTFQRTCDAKLGDARCGVDLSNPSYSATAVVVSLVDQVLTVDGISGFSAGWFTLGKVVTVSGYEVGVRKHEPGKLSLWRRPEVTISPGDTLLVTAGCKQDADTCRVKFNNLSRFKGFPFMPGNDRLTAYPVRGESDFNGGSLFK